MIIYPGHNSQSLAKFSKCVCQYQKQPLACQESSTLGSVMYETSSWPPFRSFATFGIGMTQRTREK